MLSLKLSLIHMIKTKKKNTPYNSFQFVAKGSLILIL